MNERLWCKSCHGRHDSKLLVRANALEYPETTSLPSPLPPNKESHQRQDDWGVGYAAHGATAKQSRTSLPAQSTSLLARRGHGSDSPELPT